jgi:hypothetical protein
MFKFKSLPVLAGAATLGCLAFMGHAAQATVGLVAGTAYPFDVDFCSTSCLNGALGGTVTLTQNSADQVEVDVSLSDVDFHKNMTSFVFTLDSTVAGTATIGGNPATFTPTDDTSIHQDGAGNFNFGLECATCGPQNGGIDVSSLIFDVNDSSGVSVSDFILSSGGSTNVYFAASVFNTTNTSCTGAIGVDGNASATSSTGTGGTCSTAVPAPPIGQGLPVVLAVGGLLLGFKLWERGQKRRSLGIAIPHAAA